MQRAVCQVIEAGADIVVMDSDGYTALRYACTSDVDSDAKVACLTPHASVTPQTATAAGSQQVELYPDVYSTTLRLAALLSCTTTRCSYQRY